MGYSSQVFRVSFVRHLAHPEQQRPRGVPDTRALQDVAPLNRDPQLPHALPVMFID